MSNDRVLTEYFRATGRELKGSKCPAWLRGLECNCSTNKHQGSTDATLVPHLKTMGPATNIESLQSLLYEISILALLYRY